MSYGSVSQTGFRKRVSRVPKDDNACNGRKVLLAFLNLYVRIKIRVVTSDTNHSVNDITQSIAASSRNFLILQSSQSRQLTIDKRRCARRDDQVFDQFEVSC